MGGYRFVMRVKRVIRTRRAIALYLPSAYSLVEALGLNTTDIKSGTLTFRKSTTKGKLKTRIVDIQPGLAAFLNKVFSF
jgi:integrase/recombinase XerD